MSIVIPESCRAIVGVFDRKSKTFSSVNLSTNLDSDGASFVRSLALMRRSGDQSIYAQFPADFDLCCFGFITNDGTLIPSEREVVAFGSDVLALCDSDS